MLKPEQIKHGELPADQPCNCKIEALCQAPNELKVMASASRIIRRYAPNAQIHQDCSGPPACTFRRMKNSSTHSACGHSQWLIQVLQVTMSTCTKGMFPTQTDGLHGTSPHHSQQAQLPALPQARVESHRIALQAMGLETKIWDRTKDKERN